MQTPAQGANAGGAGGSGGSAGLCLAAAEPLIWPEPRTETVPPDGAWKTDISLTDEAFFSLPLGESLVLSAQRPTLSCAVLTERSD